MYMCKTKIKSELKLACEFV